MDRASAAPGTAAAPPWPALAVPVLGTALAACGGVLTGGLQAPAGPDPEALVGLVAAGLGSAVVLVWALAAVLAATAVLARRHRRDRVAALCERCSPALLRRAAAAVLGLQLAGLPAASADDAVSPFWGADDLTPVQASPTTPGQVPSSDRGAAGPAGPEVVPAEETGAARPEEPAPTPRVGAPEPVPGDPAGETVPAPRPAGAVPVPAQPVLPPAQRAVDGAVTVVRGDTLWSLAAAHLGPGATDARIAGCWPVWYELNRHVLLDGPHLIFPGQRLLVPGRDTAAPSAPGTAPHHSPGGPS